MGALDVNAGGAGQLAPVPFIDLCIVFNFDLVGEVAVLFSPPTRRSVSFE